MGRGNVRKAALLADDEPRDDAALTSRVTDSRSARTSSAQSWTLTRSSALRRSSVSAVLSTQFKLQGTTYSIASACATSAHCIGTAMEQIQLGKQARAARAARPRGSATAAAQCGGGARSGSGRCR